MSHHYNYLKVVMQSIVQGTAIVAGVHVTFFHHLVQFSLNKCLTLMLVMVNVLVTLIRQTCK